MQRLRAACSSTYPQRRADPAASVPASARRDRPSVGARRLDLAPLDRVGISGIVESGARVRRDPAAGRLCARAVGGQPAVRRGAAAGRARAASPVRSVTCCWPGSTPFEPATRDLLAPRLRRRHSARPSNCSPPSRARTRTLSTAACTRRSTPTCCADRRAPRLPARPPARGGLRRPAARASGPAPTPRWPAALQRLGWTTIPSWLRWALLAFHWYAAHDLPEAFHASVRAGLGGPYRTAAPRRSTHLDRALELYDRVPHDGADGDPGQGRPAADSSPRPASSYDEHDRSQLLMREALDARSTPDGDRLLASRVYSSYASLCHEFEGHLAAPRGRSSWPSTYAEGRPPRSSPTALSTMALWHLSFESYSTRRWSTPTSALAVCAEVDLPVLASGSLSPAWAWRTSPLGRITEARADLRSSGRLGTPGWRGRRRRWRRRCTCADLLVFQLDPGPWRWPRPEPCGHAPGRQGCRSSRGTSGVLLAEGLMLHGRLDEADLLLGELWSRRESRRTTTAGGHAMITAAACVRGRAAAALPLGASHPSRSGVRWRCPPDWFDSCSCTSKVLAANGLHRRSP